MKKETEIKELFKVNEIRKLRLENLVDLGCEIDEGGDDEPIVANVIEIKDGDILLYDERDTDEQGVINPVWNLKDLADRVKSGALWSMKETLKNTGNPYEL